MLLHRLNQLLASDNATVLAVRKFIFGNPMIREPMRFAVRTVRSILNLRVTIRRLLRSKEHSRIEAYGTARAAGVSLSLDDLDAIWALQQRKGAVYVDADDRATSAIHALLDAAGKTWIPKSMVHVLAEAPDSIIVTTQRDSDEQLLARIGIKRPQLILRVGADGPSPYRRYPKSPAEPSLHATLRDKLARGEKLRVVLLNDIGFFYGAGIALKRQAMSFMLLGWEVVSVAWTNELNARAPAVTGVDWSGQWQGNRRLTRPYESETQRNEQFAADLVHGVLVEKPDVVVTGNLHAARIPFDVLRRIRQAGVPVFTYMHDVYLLTGRCAQPLDCTKYRTGCDAACPTPRENPALAPELIAGAWRERADYFAGENPLPLIANSHWTAGMVTQRFGAAADCRVVHLGLDHALFAPMARTRARRLLGINDSRPLVIMGAVDMNDKWKGGALFKAVHEALTKRDDVGVILFGRASEALTSVKSFGMVEDHVLPFLLNAADIFVATTIADSFGQTLLEASACGIPVVVSDVGGVKDVVVDGVTGLVTGPPSPDALLAAIDRLLAEPDLRQEMGKNGRKRVEDHFTLTRQAENWVRYLQECAP